jgi:hypothetical protein
VACGRAWRALAKVKGVYKHPVKYRLDFVAYRVSSKSTQPILQQKRFNWGSFEGFDRSKIVVIRKCHLEEVFVIRFTRQKLEMRGTGGELEITLNDFPQHCDISKKF